jgi:tetratricopeptide (TPR) repeat protein
MAMTQLGNGLSAVGNWADALSVREAELSTLRRIGAPLSAILAAQGNLANTYQYLGRLDEALPLRQDVYSGRVRLSGEEHELTLVAANNYASSLVDLQRFEEAKALLRKTNPVARRVIGASHELTLRMGWTYALALYKDDSATLADLSEAATMLEDMERIARRVLGGAHPLTVDIEDQVRIARAALAARDNR